MRTAKTDQTGRMPRLICVFAGCTGHMDGFVMAWLISCLVTILDLWFSIDVVGGYGI